MLPGAMLHMYNTPGRGCIVGGKYFASAKVAPGAQGLIGRCQVRAIRK